MEFFFAVRQLLCDNKMALFALLLIMRWIFARSQCTHLRVIKRDKLLRRIVYVPRRATETAEAHMVRWSRLLHNCGQNTNFCTVMNCTSPATSRGAVTRRV